MAINLDDGSNPRASPRALAGATVMQIVPALRDTLPVRASISVARALVRAGARAIIAGGRGELINELKGFGGEWLPFAAASFNPTQLKVNADALDKFMSVEGVHITHAKSAGAAWSALIAAKRNSIYLITELPDLPRPQMWLGSFYLGALSRGDRVIAHSMYNAGPMIVRHRIPLERINIIPRSIDLTSFSPANVHTERVAALRKAWGIPSDARIVLVPAQIAARNGHLVLTQAARILHRNGMRDVTFVLIGDDRRHRGFVRRFWRAAQEQGVDALFRVVGYHSDMPSAYAAAKVVTLPYISEPIYGRAAAEAQAMARPVVASAIGPLRNNILAAPSVADHLRTGWQVEPGNPKQLAAGISAALALDTSSYRALAARARQFAERKFAPDCAVATTLEIYASLLRSKD
jgi:glycosyltransferase involved in cell wall biosynthesis